MRSLAASLGISLLALGGTGCFFEAPLTVDEPGPVADAGFDQVRYLRSGSSLGIELDGRASCDPSGLVLDEASWSFVESPGNGRPTISRSGPLTATFEASVVGLYLVSLEVIVGDRASQPDLVSVDLRDGDGDDIVIDPPATDACGGPTG